MSYTKTKDGTYLATNGVEYCGWIGRHVLSSDGFYSTKSSTEDTAESNIDPTPRTRKCRKCGEVKPMYLFAKKPLMATSDSYYRLCKVCFAEVNKTRDRVYTKQFKREYQKNRRATDPVFKFSSDTRARIRGCIKNKSMRGMENLLGCTGEEAFNYLISRFTPDMTLEAFMDGEIHIDHIRPIASFDLTKEEEIKECFHYTNLQPLWAADNFSKGAKWDDLTE